MASDVTLCDYLLTGFMSTLVPFLFFFLTNLYWVELGEVSKIPEYFIPFLDIFRSAPLPGSPVPPGSPHIGASHLQHTWDTIFPGKPSWNLANFFSPFRDELRYQLSFRAHPEIQKPHSVFEYCEWRLGGWFHRWQENWTANQDIVRQTRAHYQRAAATTPRLEGQLEEVTRAQGLWPPSKARPQRPCQVGDGSWWTPRCFEDFEDTTQGREEMRRPDFSLFPSLQWVTIAPPPRQNQQKPADAELAGVPCAPTPRAEQGRGTVRVGAALLSDSLRQLSLSFVCSLSCAPIFL